MRQFLRKAVDIRRGEGKRIAMMAGYSFVIIASYDILKPMTRSLFVSNLGAAQLPWLYMLVALVVGIFVLFYIKFSSNVPLDRLIFWTTLFLAGNLLFFRWLLNSNINSPVLYYVLFIWASIYGVLTTTQFWLLANYLFNAREAKRLFPLLTASAILGGIMGGYFTRLLATEIGTPNLAFICIGFLGISLLLMKLAWRERDPFLETGQSTQKPAETSQSFKKVGEVFLAIRKSKHIALIMAVVGITFMVVQITEFQFMAYASEKNPNTDDLTAFLGFWLSNLSIFALFFQVGFATTIIRRFGVGVTILFLPFALLLASVWVFFSYGFISILGLKFGDRGFRHSINRVGTELLYLPIPPHIKKDTKAFIDMFVDRFARGLAGLILLISFSWIGLSVAQISLVSIGLIIVWVVISFATYREYVNSFRQAIAKRQIDPDLLAGGLNDEATINSLIISLGSRNERQIVYALDLLETVEDVDLIPPIKPLLQHSSPEVRFHTLQLMRRRAETSLLADAELLLFDEDENVQREAVRFYAEFTKDSITKSLKKWLNDENLGLRGATLFCLAQSPDLSKKLLSHELIQSFLKGGKESRRHAAGALGVIKDETYFGYLLKLLDDPETSVKIQAIKSAGKIRAKNFVPILIQSMEYRDYRKVSGQALVSYGVSIIETLASTQTDESVPIQIRTRIPRVLSLIGGQEAVDVLLEMLPQKNETLRYQIIKALNKLRTRFPELKFDKRVDQALVDELNTYFRILATLHLTKENPGENDKKFNLLERVLQERLDDHLDRIFRLLGLQYPPRDIYNAYAATTSENRSIRANAVEFLDNILSNDLKRILLPIVEELPTEQVLQKADGLIDISFSNRKKALESLIQENDPLLSASAIYEIGKNGLVEEFRPLINDALKQKNPLVQETANLVLKQSV